MSTGIPATQLIQQGIRYIQNAISWDTVTILAIAGGIGLGFMGEDWPLSLGAALSVIYVVRVGGDYMVGRFLTPTLVLCCAILMQHAPKSRRAILIASGAAFAFGLLIINPTILTTTQFGADQADKPREYLGVNDERSFSYASSGLLQWRSGIGWPNHPWRLEGLKLRDSGAHYADLMPVGMIPYFAGPGVYVYDRGALADALTARMPMPPRPWRTGHYWREPPPGYSETLQTGVNQIQDKALAEYYGHLRRIIRGGLWDPSRWEDIVLMNLGVYNHLLHHK